MSVRQLFSNERKPLHAKVLSLTWPVVLANLSLPLAGFVDTAVVGHLPDPVYIGAVALGALIFSTLYWLLAFLRMGTTGLVAQSAGADDTDEIVAMFIRSVGIGVAIGALFILLQYPIGVIIFWVFDASEAVEKFALDYYQIRIWGAIFAMSNMVVLGLLFGLQRMRTALWLQLLLNGLNIVLDLTFVLWFGWGVAGVAYATVISEIITATLGLWVCWRLLGPKKKLAFRKFFGRDKMMMLAKVNVNILIRTLCLHVVFVYFMWFSANQGDIVLAANAILLHLLTFLAFGLDGFAHAAEVLAGMAYGAKDRVRMHYTVLVTLFWSIVVAAIICLAYAIGGKLIIRVLTGIAEVRELANTHLIWLIFMPLVSVWAYLFDGVFIGLTRTVAMRNCMLTSMCIFLLVVYFFTPAFGNHGLWLSMYVFMIARGLTQSLWYARIESTLGQ